MKKRIVTFLMALCLVLSPVGVRAAQSVLGDADGSGAVDHFDAMAVLQHYAGLISETELDAAAADVDSSGTVDAFDAMYILQYFTEIIEKLPGEPEPTEPEPTEPEPTEPEPTEPEPTEPEPTEPEPTEPEPTEPEPTEPEPTEPEPTEPEPTEPEPTEPEPTEPEPTEPEKKVVDLTDKLNALMWKNAKTMQSVKSRYGKYLAAVYFYEKVKDGGDWDIKLTDEWKFQKGTTYVYQGKVMRMDDPGNIHFGYVGAVVFPEEVLCFGAGVNNITKFGFSAGNFTSYYDDPQDQEMMRWGYRLYEAEH